jgi:hypothetical protein
VATLTLTATAEPDHIPPRVRLDVTDTGGPAITAVTIYRLDSDGRQRLVRTADDGPLQVSGGSAMVYDYEIPYGAVATYVIAEGNAPTAVTTLNVGVPWLVHPGVPTRSQPIHISEFGSFARPVERGVFRVLGRSEPVVVTAGARSAGEGTISVRTKTDAGRAALDLLLDDGSPLLLNLPSDLGWGMATCYVSIGDVAAARTLEVADHPWREWVLPYLIVSRPAGGTQAAIMWDDIATDDGDGYTAEAGSQYMTWQEIADAGVASWAELAAPTT